ncbi:hypothetical protein [Anaerosporobacter sp.]|uniref:hypothetical protein n=1 Tax=Anaerosporobacter sp. TaxID=1872529 RepID=UPI00286F923D|nr:hypothetical protein [Anaerosporobacter sp.]
MVHRIQEGNKYIMRLAVEDLNKYNIEKYFNKIKGNELLDEEEKKSASEVLQQLNKTCKITSASKVYTSQEFKISNTRISIGQVSIQGEVFANDCFHDAMSVMAFLITVDKGEEKELQANLLSQYYETMWIYAALQGCRDDLVDKYMVSEEMDDRGVFTPVLGPGYFGIDLMENRQLYELLNGSKMGIVLSDKNQFTPENTICGFVVELKSMTEECRNRFNNPCCYCLATKKSCGFCDYKETT